ncbi:uncharacterized protein LOC102803560, partial [Saccoglossus kowalevskii]|uniref:Uncharacterized protein LOC102803560 n=1 Tax=Saccoglossus kowalevskii TaxID=10224 RepID=A0ABM0MWB0_SACKO
CLYNQNSGSSLSSQRENEIPTLKTANKELSGILSNLRKVEKRLEAIERSIDPDNGIAVDYNDDTDISVTSEDGRKYRHQTSRSWKMGLSTDNSADEWDDNKSDDQFFA